MDNSYHGVLHDQAEMSWVYQRRLVIGTVRGAFSGASGMIGVSAPLSCLPPPPFYSSFIPPELSSQGRYLSHQPFPPVVRSGCKGRKAWLCQVPSTECNNGNLFLIHFPSLNCPFLFWYFSYSVKWSGVSLPVAGCSIGPWLHLWLRRVLPMAEEGFFLGLGPWPNVDIDMGVLYPPQ